MNTEVDCPAYTRILECECSGIPQWSSGGKVQRWCESGDCPVVRGGKRRQAEGKAVERIGLSYSSERN